MHIVDAGPARTQTARMSQDIALEALEELGREAAQHIAGEGAVEQVEVRDGEDSFERPTYYFSFLIDQERSRQRPGLVYTRLIQKLQDELIAHGDEHLPMIRILSRADWDKRRRD